MLESGTLAWLNRNRRLAKDFETSIATAVAWIMIAGVIITGRLTRAARLRFGL